MASVFTIQTGDRSLQVKEDDPLAVMSERIRKAFDPNSNSDATSYDLTDCATYEAVNKIVEYCEYYRGRMPPRGEESARLVEFTERDEGFFKGLDSANVLYQIVLAAYYLEIEHILSICCRAVASIIVGKTPEQIREIFMFVAEDLTEEGETATESGSDED